MQSCGGGRREAGCGSQPGDVSLDLGEACGGRGGGDGARGAGRDEAGAIPEHPDTLTTASNLASLLSSVRVCVCMPHALSTYLSGRTKAYGPHDGSQRGENTLRVEVFCYLGAIWTTLV